MSILIKSGRQLLQGYFLLVCTMLAGVIIWRGIICADLLAAWMCIALAICLIFTGIALTDYRKTALASDNA